MILTKVKFTSLLIVVVLVVPVTAILGYTGFIYISSAFPSFSLATERFEESGLYKFPKGATEVYFRMAMPGPLDQGGSALKFSAGDAELSKILNTVPTGLNWQVLEESFFCNCLQCIRYKEPVYVPKGSLYWKRNKGSSDYQLLAVSKQSQQVFWCVQDT